MKTLLQSTSFILLTATSFQTAGVTLYLGNNTNYLYTVNTETVISTLIGGHGIKDISGANSLTAVFVFVNVNEPNTIGLLMLGFAGLAISRWQRR